MKKVKFKKFVLNLWNRYTVEATLNFFTYLKIKSIVSVLGSFTNKYFRGKKWQISGPNQNNFTIFWVFFKSFTHSGLDCVKTNISCLGPFTILVITTTFCTRTFKIHFFSFLFVFFPPKVPVRSCKCCWEYGPWSHVPAFKEKCHKTN